jgi:hypothetical protein
MFKKITTSRIKLTLQELFKITGHWKQNTSHMSEKFQEQQLEKICEAISLVPLKEGQTISIKNRLIKELAEDQGLDFQRL